MSQGFINREKELQWLEDRYDKASQEAQLLIIYGRRRVGKTELVRQFLRDKRHIYYLASKSTNEQQLQSATTVFAEALNEAIPPRAFPTWREFFDFFGKRVKELQERIIIVVDEFPFLVESDPGMSSFFQYGWDMYLKDSKAMFIVMGSSIAMMYKHALVYSAPLYGRRTGQWLLEPFLYKSTKNFYPKSSFENTFPLYAISGGIPAYARILDGTKDIKDNIANQFFSEGGFLATEPELLLADEFNDPQSYVSILQAIGLGRTKLSQITQTSGIPITSLPIYLKNLIRLRLVRKEIPITERIPEKSKKGSYSLADSFLRFYFSFIFPNISIIKGMNPNVVFEQHGGILTTLIAKAYEEATTEFITEAIGKGLLPTFEKMGRWWDKNTEIDLVGLDTTTNSILFVETKWNTKPLDIDILSLLKHKASQVQWSDPEKRNEYFALVAKGGFTKELIERAKREGVLLIEKDSIKQ